MIILALALVASASLFTAEAAKKKVVKKPATQAAPQAVQLKSSSDSVSYAAGMSLTNGLIPFLTQQQGVDTAYMADFVRGFQEVIKAGDDPRQKAFQAGIDIARQLRERMLPGITKEFQDSPDSIVASLLYRGFADALQKDSSVFRLTDADNYFREKQTADKAAKEEKLWGPNREAGRKFLAENARRDSVTVLPSGLQYKVITMGTGEVPKADDKVELKVEDVDIEADRGLVDGDARIVDLGLPVGAARHKVEGWGVGRPLRPQACFVARGRAKPCGAGILVGRS